ncbi:MAG: translation elongation factor Ts [Deltaproteobacteria bacterium]|nr:translation elongation factor Ts [Deltaproteobacteria bacterium]
MDVDAKTVKTLRDKTGAGMMDCKKALAETGGDMEKAIIYLREKGIASASKKSGRATREGRIVFYMHPGDKLGVMLEVNCETDFVARGEKFIEFTRDIAMHIAAAAPRYLTKDEIPADVLAQERSIYRTQALNDGKPENIVDKIVEGRMSKFAAEVCLLEQPFVKDDKVKISDFIKNGIATFGENISIARFARFKIGE